MGLFSNGRCRSQARLDGKTAIITGSNTGIGKETALDFVKRGAKVFMACRDLSKAKKAATDIQRSVEHLENCGEVIVVKLDLSSLSSVRECAAEILATETRIHLLINNAGVMMCPWGLTVDGFEMHFGTNHLGHFLFTLLLLPTILASAPARIVNVSSLAHALANSMEYDDINLKKSYSPVSAYGRSKLANVLFTKELARKLRGTGVTVYCLHPGVVSTELTRHLDSAFLWGARWVYDTLGGWFRKTVEEGAQTTLHCSLDEQAGRETGLYYDDCQVAPTTKYALDESMAHELWERSLQMVKFPAEVDPFVPKR
uniref:Retinol dehydrogenase 11 n=1 Tax=Lygus hesperus TaxID=30085 RepID=A0A0A9Z186_LYGHE